MNNNIIVVPFLICIMFSFCYATTGYFVKIDKKHLMAIAYLKQNPVVNQKLKDAFPYLTKRKSKCVNFNINTRIEFISILCFYRKLDDSSIEISDTMLTNIDKYRKEFLFSPFELPELANYNSHPDAKIVLTLSKPLSNYLIVEFLDANYINSSFKSSAVQVLFVFGDDDEIEEVYYASPIYN